MKKKKIDFKILFAESERVKAINKIAYYKKAIKNGYDKNEGEYNIRESENALIIWDWIIESLNELK